MDRFRKISDIICLIIAIPIFFFGLYQIYHLTNILITLFVLFIIGLLGLDLLINLKASNESDENINKELRHETRFTKKLHK